MLIIIFEFLVMLYIAKQIKKKNLKNVYIYLFIALFIQLTILFFYRVELREMGRVVYFSDAEVYWEQTLLYMSNGKILTGQDGYVKYCSIIQITSPFYSVVWNNISNLFLLDISILMIANMALLNGIKLINIKWFLIMLLNNPLVYYGLFRNLKDSLFLFILTLIIYLFDRYFKNKNIIYLIIAIILDLYVSRIRPWGFLILPMCICGYYMNELLKKGNGWRKIILTIILISTIPIMYIVLSETRMLDHLEVWTPVIEKNTSSQSIVSLLLGPFVIVLGPGWYRALFGSRYFMFYTSIGNLCCFIGAVIWWIQLSIFLSKIKFHNFIKSNKIASMLLIILVFILMIYTMQYGGSLEIRFRSIIYVLLSSTYLFMNQSFVLNKINKVSVFFCVFIFMFGTIMSI